MNYVIAAMYKFVRLPDYESIQPGLLAFCREQNIKGTLLLAEEGINGTIAGPRAGIDVVLRHIRALPGCAEIAVKESEASLPPFLRLKVRLKKEIVTLGQPAADPTARVGTYVAPEDWNALVAAEDVAVIDTRNAYEVDVGTFEGAINPETASFTEFPAWWRANAARFEGKRVAMFCTGGIRCEKASSWLLS